MPDINQLFFSNKELVEIMIKKAGIHEGKWMLIVNFGFNPGNFNTSPSDVVPGALITVANMGLMRVAPEAPDPLSVDAAIVNPAA